MNVLMVNIVGLLLILGIIYWFWLFKQKSTLVDDKVTIVVKDGAYIPNVIQVKHNVPIKLIFVRKDPNPCAEYVVFNELNISEQLPLNKDITIMLANEKQGEFEFACQMGMYRGKIIVE